MRYYRSREDKIIAGVCGGLGKYTGIDPLFWRIATLFIPGAASVYLVIWICSKKTPLNTNI